MILRFEHVYDLILGKKNELFEILYCDIFFKIANQIISYFFRVRIDMSLGVQQRQDGIKTSLIIDSERIEAQMPQLPRQFEHFFRIERTENGQMAFFTEFALKMDIKIIGAVAFLFSFLRLSRQLDIILSGSEFHGNSVFAETEDSFVH